MTDKELRDLALSIASDAHKGQTRWSNGEDYINHPLRVAQAVKDAGIDYEVTAILHDVVEDSHWTLDMLRERGIPENIVEAVDSVTDRKNQGETYLDFVLRAGTNVIGSVIKRADIRDNLRDLKKGSLKDKYEMALWILGRAIVIDGKLTYV